jgi:hypothetical protein
MQPFFRANPLTLHSATSDAEHFAGLVVGEAGEESAFDDATHAFIVSEKAVERFVNGEQRFRALIERRDRFPTRCVERDSVLASSALVGAMTARVVDEDATHDAGGDREEMPAIGPLCARLVHESHIRLVHERRGAECVIGALPAELVVRDAAQIVVDDLEQPVARCAVTAPPGVEESGHVVLWVQRRLPP